MNKVNVEALLVRAFKTFLQGFAGSLLALSGNINDLATGKAVLIGALAAGVSALMNLFLTPQEAK